MIKFHLRPLIPGEHDPELIWGLIVAVSEVLVLAWIWSGLPTPLCTLHALTGIPCPTCGMTRGLRSLLHGDLESAFLFNPLGLIVLFAALLYVIYVAIVVIGRLPRLRWETMSSQSVWCLRLSIMLLLTGNWLYLILRERALFL